MRRPALLALTALLAACQPSAQRDPSSAGGGALPDTAMVRDVTLGGTTTLIGGDLGEVSPSVAIQTLDLWVARLDTVSAEGVPALRDDLTTLRNLLQSSPLDGRAIGETMRRLGDHTDALAEPGDDLGRLGRALRAAGERLAPDTTETPTPPVTS